MKTTWPFCRDQVKDFTWSIETVLEYCVRDLILSVFVSSPLSGCVRCQMCLLPQLWQSFHVYAHQNIIFLLVKYTSIKLKVKRNGSNLISWLRGPLGNSKISSSCLLGIFFLSHFEDSECYPVPTLETSSKLLFTFFVMIISVCLLVCLSIMPLARITTQNIYF